MILMTAKGRTIPLKWHGRSTIDRVLYFGLTEISAAEAVAIFNDPTETSRLTVYKDEQNMNDEGTVCVYTGFTEFTHVRVNSIEGTVNVGVSRMEVSE